MDFINKFTGENKPQAEGQQQAVAENAQTTQSSGSSGGFLGGLTDKFNNAAGGGRESEKNEDYLDKGKVSPKQLARVPH